MTTAKTLRTLARFLLGKREAIEQVAASKAALWASLVFVLSAGLAREYDGEYLLAEPWHFLRPIGASLASGTVLFLLVHPWVRANIKPEQHSVSLGVAYRQFMTCFWMTAPLAWLYAIPYERFMLPADAVLVNLWTLALVAVWRVILITRVASVLYQTTFTPMFFIVMLFADALAWAVVTYIPAPVMDFMGGVQHTERDAILASATFNIQILSFVSAPIWIIGALIAMNSARRVAITLPNSALRPNRSWLTIAAASLLIWIPPLLIAQPEQARRHAVMQHFEADNIPAALDELSKYERRDLPLRWELPPRLGYREHFPRLGDIRLAIDSQQTAAWVASEYAEKTWRDLRSEVGFIENSWAETLRNFNRKQYDELAESKRLRLSNFHIEQLQFVQRHLTLTSPEEAAALQSVVERLESLLNASQPSSDPES